MNIYKAKTDVRAFSDGRARLFAKFANVKGQPQGDFQWAPARDDVSDIIVKAVVN